ncbi:MAG: TM2 domain-containing protein [Eubacterium sp.]|nr:TM2 domain-containing protein [Eubacterium sp.]
MLKVLRRNKTIAGVLAIFAGTIGLHCFYMGNYKKGLIYLLFFWTGIPTVLGIIDGARLFTQVAEEDDLETDDQVTSISDETVEEVTKKAVEEIEKTVEKTETAEKEVVEAEKTEADETDKDLGNSDVDDIDETEENDEDDEVEEKIKSLRKMNSRRKKKCQK